MQNSTKGLAVGVACAGTAIAAAAVGIWLFTRCDSEDIPKKDPAPFSPAPITPSRTPSSDYFPPAHSFPGGLIDTEVESTYNGIPLCKQHHLDCWAYAAMFAAAVKGKCNRVDMEKDSPLRDEIMKACGRNDHTICQDGNAPDVINALKAMKVDEADIHDAGRCGNLYAFANDLYSYFESGAKVLCLRCKDHWVALLPSKKGWDRYMVFNSLGGDVTSMGVESLFQNLPFAKESKYSAAAPDDRDWEVVWVR